MRVTTAFNRVLEIPGASVRSVAFERDGVVVGLRRRSKRLVCPRCGCLGRGSHGQRPRRWRHLDLGATRCYLECELRRFRCPGSARRSSPRRCPGRGRARAYPRPRGRRLLARPAGRLQRHRAPHAPQLALGRGDRASRRRLGA
jgi:transposase